MSFDEHFSLLYPPEIPGESRNNAIERSFLSSLAVESLFGAMRGNSRYKPNTKHPIEYMTCDAEVIQYRLDVVEDILNNRVIRSLLEEMLPKLQSMKEIFSAVQGLDADTTAAMYSIAELELYTECIDQLNHAFQQENIHPHSTGFQRFAELITEIHESETYQRLKSESEKVTSSIRSIKSITIGVNLDAQLRPVEAGLVSVNTELYKSGNIMDKILRMNFKDDGYNCLAPLETMGKGARSQQNGSFQSAVNRTLNTVLETSVKKWRPVIRTYMKDQARFLLRLADEIDFLLGATSLLMKLKESGYPICKPETRPMEQNCFAIRDLYNPLLALESESTTDEDSKSPVVLNDLEFDDNGMIYVLTGPNQGGKTVFTRAVGLAQLMFQLGLFVPGFSAVLSPVDQIFTHFPIDNDTVNKSRFAEECSRLMQAFKSLTSHSLLLMDETFSSTSAAEAAVIAEQVLQGLQAAGCRVIFSTHLHDLARKIDELNQSSSDQNSRIDSLVAELNPTQMEQGQRAYRINRTRPKGNSYAQDIAEKYGLTYEGLIEALDNR